MASRIFLFPDTNLFVQCKPLDQLDWSAWAQYEEVSLLVSRPVQSEIDKQKGGGNSRLATRARKASSLFREILLSADNFIEFRKGNPTVRLYLRPELKRDESLAGQLSYDERDDQLVGIASLFAKSNEGYEVAVLTHDTGPMATAQLIGLPFTEVPDSWLLAAEVDEAQKKINALQAENARLKSAEPSFEVYFKSNSDDSSTVQMNIPMYVPLSQDEVASLMDKVRSSFPLEADFGSKVPEQRSVSRNTRFHLGGVEKFTPATDDEISTYQTEEYPNWINACEALFVEIHTQLNRKVVWPELVVGISNTGSRPAEDTLVTFTTSEKFGIQPPRPRKDEDDDQEPEPELGLPRPPSVPKGTWKLISPRTSILGIQGLTTQHLMPSFRHVSLPSTFKRDPNVFYYKDRPYVPTSSFALTCEQFRHRGEEEDFEMTVYASLAPGDVAGVIEVRVEAANISAPLIERIPVRISISEVSSLSEAEELIEKLIQRTRPTAGFFS